LNKIYKKIWNKALGRLVVASELASSQGAGTVVGAGGRVANPLHLQLAIAVALALVAAGAQAQQQDVDVGADGSVTAGQTVLDNEGLRVGAAVAIGANAISVGSMVMDAGTNQLSGLSNTAWNPGSFVAGRAATEGQLKVVSDAANAGWNVAVGGTQAKIGPGGQVTFAGGSNITVTQTGGDDNASLSVALNPNVNLGASGSLTTGATTVNNAGVTIGSTSVGSNAITVGNASLASNGLSITNGPRFTATGIDANNQKITSLNGGAILAGSTEAVTGGQLHALQELLYNTGQGTRYFRVNSTTGDSSALGADSMAIGKDASTGVEAGSAIAIGQEAATDAAGSVAIGSKVQGGGQFATNTVAVGTEASVTGNLTTRAVAIGAGASAGADSATALGADSTATGAHSIALGQSTATAGNAFAAGTGALAATPDSIALGTGAGVGTAPNAANDRTSHIAIGTNAGRNVAGNQNTGVGYQAGTGVTGDQNVAIGSAAGNGITGDYNVAIGFNANKDAGTINNATAVGRETQAGLNAAAFGANAVASGTGSVALGNGTAQAR